MTQLLKYELKLTKEERDILLRCLAYGEKAVSSNEIKDGTAKKIEETVLKIRQVVAEE